MESTTPTPQPTSTGRDGGDAEALLGLRGISKRYGHTQALDGADLVVQAGELLGLVGHNGAGKSTLMRVITGLTEPDSGAIEFDGRAVTEGYSLAAARSLGIRIAFQELSLCPTLRVFENVVVSRPDLRGLGWHGRARDVIASRLDEIFPGQRVSPDALIGRLSLAQRQMVEIAQATLGGEGEVKLLILDEPTSALSRKAADSLFTYLKAQRSQGLSSIVISHRLGEIFAQTDRVVVLRDGRSVADRPTRDLDTDEIVALMGAGESDSMTLREERRKVTEEAAFVVETRGLTARGVADVSIHVREGEIVGLAGLDGQGQQELLLALWRRRKRGRGAVDTRGGMAFVTGDRQTEGIFPLSSLAGNVSIGSIGSIGRFGIVHPKSERALARRWIDRLDIRGRADSPIVDLSGGNQQKALVARALAAPARVILLDDPFRGVDVGTRRETYHLMREETLSGRSFLWFTTENAELEECDRVYILRGGAVVEELAGAEITEEAIVGASFDGT